MGAGISIVLPTSNPSVKEPETGGCPPSWTTGQTGSQNNTSNKTGILKPQCKITRRFDSEEDMKHEWTEYLDLGFPCRVSLCELRVF